jgi:hypothetical protein
MPESVRVVYDVKGLMANIKAIEPGLKKAMTDEAKGESQGLQTLIRKAIPDVAPLSGMNKINNPSGRLAWGAVKPADKVEFRYKTTGSNRRAITPLFKLMITSPMTAIADTAGKGSGVPRSLTSKPYRYQGGTRTHKLNGQGRSMIINLKRRNGSNFVYPAVEAGLPSVELKLKLVVEKYALKVNRKLN